MSSTDVARPASDERASAIVAATRHVMNEFGIRRATVTDVAKAASVSRQTVYEYFPTREALIQAALEEGARDLVRRAVQSAERAERTPRRRLAASMAVPLHFFAESPLWASSSKREELLVHVTVEGGVFLEATAHELQLALEAWWPDADPVRVRRAADTVARTLISHGLAPSGEPIGEVVHELASLVAAGLEG